MPKHFIWPLETNKRNVYVRWTHHHSICQFVQHEFPLIQSHYKLVSSDSVRTVVVVVVMTRGKCRSIIATPLYNLSWSDLSRHFFFPMVSASLKLFDHSMLMSSFLFLHPSITSSLMILVEDKKNWSSFLFPFFSSSRLEAFTSTRWIELANDQKMPLCSSLIWLVGYVDHSLSLSIVLFSRYCNNVDKASDCSAQSRVEWLIRGSFQTISIMHHCTIKWSIEHLQAREGWREERCWTYLVILVRWPCCSLIWHLLFDHQTVLIVQCEINAGFGQLS